MHRTLLRALEHARNGDFQRCRDMFYDFEPLTLVDEYDLDYAWSRMEEYECRQAG